MEKYLPKIVEYGWPILLALVIVWLGSKIARVIGRKAETLFNKSPNSDPSLSRFFGSLIRYAILAAVIMGALGIVGVDTSSFAAIIVGMGAAMAFVLQGSLSNIAAGGMLMLFRPFKIGDEIEAGGAAGKVSEIGLTATRFTTTDNKEIIISNGKIWGGTIRNNSSLGDRRLDMQFGISYDQDIDQAISVLTNTAASHPLVLSEPAPWAKVVNLNESSVDIELRAWCKASDYKALKVSISRPVKEAFNKASIEIPYPRETKISKHVKNSKGRDRLARLKSLRNS